MTVRRAALLAVTAFLFAAPLLAQEGEHAAEPFFTTHRIFWLINLVVFFAILFKVAGPAICCLLSTGSAGLASAARSGALCAIVCWKAASWSRTRAAFSGDPATARVAWA